MADNNNSAFFIDQIRNNDYVKVMITLPGSPQQLISGFVTQDFAFSAGAEFTSSADGGMNSLTQANNAMNSARDVAAEIGIGSGGGSQKVIGMNDTIEKFSGFKKPVFNIPLMFIATSPDMDVRKDVRRLLAAGFPKLQGRLIDRAVIEAPFGYHSNAADLTATNTCALQIGKWFRANNLLITEMNYNFSKEVIKSGLPLYAKVDVTMTPFRLPSLEEAQSYIT